MKYAIKGHSFKWKVRRRQNDHYKKAIKQLTLDGFGRFISKSVEDKYRKFKSESSKDGKYNDATVSIIYNGKLITITTFGDGTDILKGFYKQYNGYADILVCAGHPTNSFNKLFGNWGKSGNELYQIDKDTDLMDADAERRCKSDKEFADKIIKVIKSLI